MREALARSDNDFLVAEPRRRKPAPRPSRFSTLIGIARFLPRLANYPNRIAGALLVGIAVAIAVNALELQTSRHPAPLFGHATLPQQPPAPAAQAPQPESQAAARIAPAPQPVATPAPADPLGQFIRQDEQTMPRHRAVTAAAPPARPDRISQILEENSGPPPAPSRTVLAAQRALVKLGYVLRADGIDGEATHRAIVQYESDRHLPARGELSAKLLRQLSAESGIAIP
ncbi:MAG: peptidoglycan-binding protein [Methylovirgula sp.]|nr:peptidoglycan-binding protein [Methylovirgula sp.]